MTFNQIISDLERGEYQNVYFLHGNESYFIDAISGYIEKNALSEGEKSFNQTIRHGLDTIIVMGKRGGRQKIPIDFKTLFNDLTRLPMMSPYNVVILKEAQHFRDLPKMVDFLKLDSKSTIFVICHKHKRYNLNSKLGKALKKANAVIYESKKVPEYKLEEWIRNFLKENGFNIAPQALRLIAEYLGSDLGKIVNEIEKMKISIKVNTTISAKQIREFIGISKEYNVFELQKAIGLKQISIAQKIIIRMSQNTKKNPLVIVISSLYNYFSKIFILHALKNTSEQEILKKLKLRSSFFLREYRAASKNYNQQQTEKIISILKEYDLTSKGIESIRVNNPNSAVMIPDGELMKEMVWRILNA